MRGRYRCPWSLRLIGLDLNGREVLGKVDSKKGSIRGGVPYRGGFRP